MKGTERFSSLRQKPNEEEKVINEKKKKSVDIRVSSFAWERKKLSETGPNSLGEKESKQA